MQATVYLAKVEKDQCKPQAHSKEKICITVSLHNIGTTMRQSGHSAIAHQKPETKNYLIPDHRHGRVIIYAIYCTLTISHIKWLKLPMFWLQIF